MTDATGASRTAPVTVRTDALSASLEGAMRWREDNARAANEVARMWEETVYRDNARAANDARRASDNAAAEHARDRLREQRDWPRCVECNDPIAPMYCTPGAEPRHRDC